LKEIVVQGLFKIIPRDKLLHLAVGAGAAGFAFAAWKLCMLVPLLAAHPLATAISLGGLMVGLTKEAGDRLGNLAVYHRGEAPIHGVEWFDVLFTWAGATVVAVGLVLAGLA
jgi:hypothetical protein